jgi:hypothetical protein
MARSWIPSRIQEKGSLRNKVKGPTLPQKSRPEWAPGWVLTLTTVLSSNASELVAIGSPPFSCIPCRCNRSEASDRPWRVSLPLNANSSLE